MTRPTPLEPSSPRLRDGRFEASPYSAPSASSPSGVARYSALDEVARFTTLADAMAYADATWPDAPFIFVDRFAESRGWAPYRAAERVGGTWT